MNSKAEIQRRKYKVKLTPKQDMALKLLMSNPKLTITEAMRQAGYADKSLAHPSKTLLGSRAVLQAHDKWVDLLARHGVCMETLADKYSILLEAKKTLNTRTGLIEVPDNDIQLKTVEILKKDLGLVSQNKQEEQSIVWTWKKPVTSIL